MQPFSSAAQAGKPRGLILHFVWTFPVGIQDPVSHLPTQRSNMGPGMSKQEKERERERPTASCVCLF